MCIRDRFRDREVEEADRLVEELSELSRLARLQHRPPPAASNGHEGTPPSGWYPDPSGRHEQRYWHEGQWTEQVANGGRRSAEAPMPAP